MSQCEHGHPVELIDDCPRCGAPQCCPWCCEVQSLEAAGKKIITAIQAGLSQDEIEAIEEFNQLAGG